MRFPGSFEERISFSFPWLFFLFQSLLIGEILQFLGKPFGAKRLLFSSFSLWEADKYFCMYVYIYIYIFSRSFFSLCPFSEVFFPQGFLWSIPQLVWSRIEFVLDVQGVVSPIPPGYQISKRLVIHFYPCSNLLLCVVSVSFGWAPFLLGEIRF